MHITRNTTLPAPHAAFIPPILLIRNLAERARGIFPDVALTLGNIYAWALQQIGLQRKWAEDVRAIDDPLEQNAALIEEVLANDPPAKRRRVKKLLAEVHARSEQRARELTPEVQFDR
jgi:phage/plasmid-associated DNA primase